MADNWDDDDFEPDVAAVLPPKDPAPTAIAEASNAQGKTAGKPKGKEISMESLGRELSAAEREELQRRQDMKLAREMMGLDEIAEDRPYADILTKEEFEEWGDKMGTFIATRHKAAHYGDLLGKLLTRVSEKMSELEIRKMSTHLKTLADSKKGESKAKPGAPKPAPTTTPGAQAKVGKGGKSGKATLKVSKGSDNLYDDYGDDGGYGGYDDAEDNFM